MSKLNIEDSFHDIMIKMSEGNPGALNCIFKLKEKHNNDIKWIHSMLAFDTMELYGSYLYMFVNDCCDNDYSKVIQIIEAWQKGEIPIDEINNRIKLVGRGLPFDDLLEVKNEKADN